MANSATDGEPTMEEILSSIRKIISEDEPETGGAPAEAGMAQTEVEDLVDEVLELTDRVEDAGGDDSEEQEIDAILTSVTETPGADMTGNQEQRSPTGGLISSETDSAVTSTLAGFFDEMVKDKSPPDGKTISSPTLEEVVREVLGPYLKNWLDENLETIVERTVRDELKRMARRAEDL